MECSDCGQYFEESEVVGREIHYLCHAVESLVKKLESKP